MPLGDSTLTISETSRRAVATCHNAPVTTYTDRAVAYVVRDDGRLLVHVHADEERPWEYSGLQVPSGGIQPAERPEDGVLREVTEETGLTNLRVVAYLGSMDWDLRPYVDMVAHRHFFHLAADGHVPDEWMHREMGGPGEPPRADDGVLFRHYWLPVPQCHVLSGGLGAMLGRLWDSVEATR